MELVVGFDIISTIAFGVALLSAFMIKKKRLDFPSKLFFIMLVAIYFFVGLSNILEHGNITAFLDSYEDYAEILFAPFFMFFVFSVLSRQEMEKRLLSEARLRENEERYRTITDAAHDSIIMIDQHGRISFWNPAAERLFGYEKNEVLGRDLHELIVPENLQAQSKNAIKHYVETGRGELIGKTVEVTGQKKDGTRLLLEISLSALKIGDKWGAVSIIRDISKRKEDEEEKERLHIHLRRAQKMEAIGTLAGGVAHDFNNILTAIIGYSNLVNEELPEKSAARKNMQQVLNAADRATELVQQILAFTRRTESKLDLVQTHLVVKEALNLLRATIPATIEIKQDIDTRSGFVRADPTQIYQIMMNLCTNAFQAMEDNGIMEISLKAVEVDAEMTRLSPDLRVGEYIRLTVKDTGHGIDPEIMGRIFEPYFTTREVRGGTGLGLAVVYGIISGLGGGIMVRSQPGKGSTFQVYLPRYTAGLVRKDEIVESVSGGSEHILYVDDEETLVALVREILKRLGYQVSIFTSSTQALEALKSNPEKYDLVITDFTMPGMTGVDLAKQIRLVRADLPIILTTGYSDKLNPEEVKELGINELVMKPVVVRELGKLIRKTLDRKKSA